jgi:exonuclease SbcC
MQAASELRDMEAKVVALPAPVRRVVSDVDGAERALVMARAAVTEIEVEVRVGRDRIETIRSTAGKVTELEGARAAAEQELSEWTRLAEDLGRDGLQAMEIDAAGPELTVLVNDLLHTCIGSRWTVMIETQRNSSNGKKVIEGCEVRVIDTGTETVAGREGLVETFSGGERVLIGEAVSLALAMLECRRSGLQGGTLVRDETGAALDEEVAPRYIAMLRRAAQLCGFSRIFFVSHNSATWALADARLHFSDGKVTVQ